MQEEIFRASVVFAGDTTMGQFPYGFDLQIPDFRVAFHPSEKVPESSMRELVRQQIKKMYELLDGENTATVYFSDEVESEQEPAELAFKLDLVR